jgi:hypothetical protein
MDVPTIVTTTAPRPLKLTLDPAAPVAGLRNDEKLVKQILVRLKRGPSDQDGPGFIYMYKEHGKKNGYRKIGRTQRLPSRRLEEWPGSELVKSWGCKRNRLAEVLIHWLLDEVRIYRYVMAVDTKTGLETLLSIWKRNREFLKDPTYQDRVKRKLSLALKDPATGKPRKRHTEWFMQSDAVLSKVIQSVVTDINVHWSAEVWPEWMEAIK